jgi:hypothetical protein
MLSRRVSRFPHERQRRCVNALLQFHAAARERLQIVDRGCGLGEMQRAAINSGTTSGKAGKPLSDCL